LCCEIDTEASCALSMRPNARRSPWPSTTAMFMSQPRFLASATPAAITALARSIEIDGPYGVANGILSGMASRFGAWA
jgi:hypothetical protein